MFKYSNVFHVVRNAVGRALILFFVLVILPLLATVFGGQMNEWQTAVHIAEAAEPLGEWEIGENDFPISEMGSAAEFLNVDPAVAYNVVDDQYLVVWAANDTLNGETAVSQIAGRLLDGSGQPLGPDFTIIEANDGLDISRNLTIAYNRVNNRYLVAWPDHMPNTGEWEILGIHVNPDGTPNGSLRALTSHGLIGVTTADVDNPELVHNPVSNEYMLVYEGDNANGTANGEFEIFYVRLDGVLLNRLGKGRISDMGPIGSSSYDAMNPDIAFDPNTNEYLVVWFADSDGSDAGVVNNEYEIFGQRLSSTGAEIGNDDFRISDMGPNGDSEYDAFAPSVAFNSTDNEYLVVWRGDDTFGPGGDEDEIYGQRLTAGGQPVGGNDFRISHMGPDGNGNYDAALPDVIYSPNNNNFMVVWEADDNSGGMVDGEIEIFGRVVSAAGQPAGASQTRLSQMGPDGNVTYSGALAALTYNTTADEYFVVWQGFDDREAVRDGEAVVFAQRLNGPNGQEVGENDAMVSDFQELHQFFDAYKPAVAFNSADNEYLVVWSGDNNVDDMVIYELEIFAQRLDADSGQKLGPPIRLSDMGPAGNPDFSADLASVAYNPIDNEYLIVWEGDDGTDDDFDIFGQRLSADGQEVGANDFRISDMGPNGQPSYPARAPDVVFNSAENEYLVVWSGDDTASGEDTDFEIFGQRLTSTGAEIGLNDFRISEGLADFPADTPAVTHNSLDNQYLVVWRGIDEFNEGKQEYEIFGQILTAAGDEIGADDFRISDMGPDGSVTFTAYDPALAHNPANNQYLVVWSGDDDIPQEIRNVIFGQRLDAAGNEIGVNDFPISDATPNVDNVADTPTVVVDPATGNYLVAWSGYDEISGTAAALDHETFARQVDAGGGVIGDIDVRLSDMGPDGVIGYQANPAALAFNNLSGEYLVVWSGNDVLPGEYNDEIFGQRFIPTSGVPPTAANRVYLPFVVNGG